MDGRESDTEDNTNTANSETLSTQHTESTSTEDHINAKECAQQSAEKCSQRWPKRMTTPQPSMCGEDMTSTLLEIKEQTRDCPLSSLLNSLSVNNNFDVNNDNIFSDNAITIEEKMNETLEYSRDSFDRFGDDLCKEILRYLSISDCFEFQCVSKMFKRSAFGAKKVLDTRKENLFFSYNSLIVFECALKKCLYINEIIISHLSITDRLIEIIIENCSHLTSITISGNLFNCHFIFERKERQHIIPKIKKIGSIFNEKSDFQSFADIYCDRVETIILRRHDYGFTRMRVMFEQLSRFRCLQVLHIESNLLQYYNDIDNAFDLIAENCKKLRELSLHSDSTIFSQIRHRFASLTRLTLQSFYDVSFVCLNINDLSCCPNLTHLRFKFYSFRIDIEHLADIHLHLPKLQCFELECEEDVTNQLLESLALLKNLYYIKVTAMIERVTDTELRNFIKVCKSIRKIDIDCVSSISRQTIDEFVSHAKRGSKRYNYSFRLEVMNDDESVSDNELKDITNDLPKNISIEIPLIPDDEGSDGVYESDGEIDK